MAGNGSFMEKLVRRFYDYCFWRWHRNLPVLPARIFSVTDVRSKNLESNPYYVPLKSYDGSRQLTHPDTVLWRGELWLAATPYPYSRESYENPCVYRSSDGVNWRPCRRVFPVVKVKNSEIGRVHYSDPVLLPSDNGIILYYRRRVRGDKEIMDSLHMSLSRDGFQWSKPRMISESVQNNFISPAVLVCGDSLMMFHIDLYTHQQTGALILRRSTDSITWEEGRECRVSNLTPDTGLWHIAVCGADGGRNAGEGKIKGLFVIKHVNGDYEGVYRAVSNDFGLSWHLGGRLELPGRLTGDMKKPYKASFIPDSEDIMISLEDLRGRWYIYRVPGIFCEDGDNFSHSLLNKKNIKNNNTTN